MVTNPYVFSLLAPEESELSSVVQFGHWRSETNIWYIFLGYISVSFNLTGWYKMWFQLLQTLSYHKYKLAFFCFLNNVTVDNISVIYYMYAFWVPTVHVQNISIIQTLNFTVHVHASYNTVKHGYYEFHGTSCFSSLWAYFVLCI